MPALSWLADKKEPLWYLVIGCFLLQSVAPDVFSALGLAWNSELTIKAASGFVMYALLGYLLSTTDFSGRQRRAIYVLGAFGLLFRFFWTLVTAELSGSLGTAFFEYLGFPTVLYSAAVFVWFRQRDLSNLKRWESGISAASACSFGIYLIHYPILHKVVFGMMGLSPTSVLTRTVFPPFFYLALLVVVYFMRKIPVVRRTLP